MGVGEKLAPHKGHCSNGCSPLPSSPSPWCLPVSPHLRVLGFLSSDTWSAGGLSAQHVFSIVLFPARPGPNPNAKLVCPELSAPSLLLVSRLLTIISCPPRNLPLSLRPFPLSSLTSRALSSLPPHPPLPLPLTLHGLAFPWALYPHRASEAFWVTRAPHCQASC